MMQLPICLIDIFENNEEQEEKVLVKRENIGKRFIRKVKKKSLVDDLRNQKTNVTAVRG